MSRTREFIKRRWKILLLIVLAVVVAVLWGGLAAYGALAPSDAARRWAVYFSGVAALILIWVFLCLLQGGVWGIKGLFLGEDKRPSTSLFQFFLWTVAAIYTFVAVFAARYTMSGNDARDAMHINIPQQLLIAMGFSIVTATGAKAITTYQVRTRQIVKTPPSITAASASGAGTTDPTLANKGGLGAIFLADDDQPDLTKIQMVAWTFVAVGAYLVSVWAELPRIMADAKNAQGTYTLPDIALSLVVLMGLGQGTYLGTKLILSSTPQLSAIDPPFGDKDTTLSLTGTGFGSEQGGSLLYLNGSAAYVPIAPESWTDRKITFKLPPTQPGGDEWTNGQSISVQAAVGGQLSNAVKFIYRPAHVTAITPSEGDVNTAFVLIGINFGSTQGKSQLYLDDAPVTVTISVADWTDEKIAFKLPATPPGVPGWTNGQSCKVQVKVGDSLSNSTLLTYRLPVP